MPALAGFIFALHLMPFTNNQVNQSFVNEGFRAPMVYGKYKASDYQQTTNESICGFDVTEQTTPRAAFESANALWTADKREGWYMGQDGPVQSKEFISLVNSSNDAWLGNHSPHYEPVQNTTLCELITDLGLTVENILQMNNGKKIYIQCSLDQKDVVEGDSVRHYLHLYNSHNASQSMGLFFSTRRLACANALGTFTGSLSTRASRQGKGLKFRHVKNVNNWVANIPQLIDLETKAFAGQVEDLRRLTRVKLTKEIATKTLETVFAESLAKPIIDKDKTKQEGKNVYRDRTIEDITGIDRMRSHFSAKQNTGYGMELTSSPDGPTDNLYRFMNSVTQVLTHESPSRGQNKIIRTQARLNSLYHGDLSKRVNCLRETLLTYA